MQTRSKRATAAASTASPVGATGGGGDVETLLGSPKTTRTQRRSTNHPDSITATMTTANKKRKILMDSIAPQEDGLLGQVLQPQVQVVQPPSIVDNHTFVVEPVESLVETMNATTLESSFKPSAAAATTSTALSSFASSSSNPKSVIQLEEEQYMDPILPLTDYQEKFSSFVQCFLKSPR